jgi:hypothetical protein
MEHYKIDRRMTKVILPSPASDHAYIGAFRERRHCIGKLGCLLLLHPEAWTEVDRVEFGEHYYLTEEELRKDMEKD